jgi:hypothetical protein
MKVNLDDVERVYLFISSVSKRCVAPEKYVRSRPRHLSSRFPVVITRLDTKDIRKKFVYHPTHPIKSVPTLMVVLSDGSREIETTEILVMKFLKSYDAYLERALTEDNEEVVDNDEEVVEDDEQPPPPPPQALPKRKAEPPQPPKLLQSEVSKLKEGMEIIDDDEDEAENGRMEIINDDDENDEVPQQKPPSTSGLKINNGARKNDSMESLKEAARKMEEMAKQTTPGLNEKRFPSYV